MRADLGQSQLDAVIVRSSVEDRVARVTAKRAAALPIVWQQVDSAGIVHPVEQARFLLGRLYPDLPPAWLEDTIAIVSERHAQGRWHGYPRPDTTTS
jgi:hypothetical protein